MLTAPNRIHSRYKIYVGTIKRHLSSDVQGFEELHYDAHAPSTQQAVTLIQPQVAEETGVHTHSGHKELQLPSGKMGGARALAAQRSMSKRLSTYVQHYY